MKDKINKENKISVGKNETVQKINKRNKKKEVKLENMHVKLYKISKWTKNCKKATQLSAVEIRIRKRNYF